MIREAAGVEPKAFVRFGMYPVSHLPSPMFQCRRVPIFPSSLALVIPLSPIPYRLLVPRPLSCVGVGVGACNAPLPPSPLVVLPTLHSRSTRTSDIDVDANGVERGFESQTPLAGLSESQVESALAKLVTSQTPGKA